MSHNSLIYSRITNQKKRIMVDFRLFFGDFKRIVNLKSELASKLCNIGFNMYKLLICFHILIHIHSTNTQITPILTISKVEQLNWSSRLSINALILLSPCLLAEFLVWVHIFICVIYLRYSNSYIHIWLICAVKSIHYNKFNIGDLVALKNVTDLYF